MSDLDELSRSNALTDLAHRIKTEHEAVSTALKESVRHAIAAGEMLIEAKRHPQLKHGDWLPWLRDHCGIQDRTAQRYMRIARNKGTIEDQIRHGVSDLTQNGALALLTIPKDNTKPEHRCLESALNTYLDCDDLDEALANMAARAKRKPLLDKAMADMNRIGELVLADDRLVESLEALAETFGPEIRIAGEAFTDAALNDQHDAAYDLAHKLQTLATDYLRQVEAAASNGGAQ
jgi:hypothetical protein